LRYRTTRNAPTKKTSGVFDRGGVQVVDLGHDDRVIAGGMLGDELTLK
jgi:hypothetical protein